MKRTAAAVNTYIVVVGLCIQLAQLQLPATEQNIIGAALTTTNAVNDQSIVAIRSDNLTLLFQVENDAALAAGDDSLAQTFVVEQPISIRFAKWQVAIVKNGVFTCSGSVIGPKWVLTAAQCVDASAQYLVRGGTRYFRSGGQTRRVDLVILDEQYHAQTAVHDLALLRLNRRFQFTERLQPAQLPAPNAALPQEFFISGWTASSKGYQQQPYSGLHGVIVDLADTDECARNTAWLRNGNLALPEHTFCTRNNYQGQCHGDLGSPIVAAGVLYGVFSHDSGCYNRYYSGVNTDIRLNREWITSVMKRYGAESKVVDFPRPAGKSKRRLTRAATQKIAGAY